MPLHSRWAGVGAGIVTLAFAWGCARFVAQPSLATFADDSVNYLVMAQVFSPWQAASAPVAEAFAREAFYPPLFPMVLALAGAAHDFVRAHVVTALLVAAWLPCVYLLGSQWLGSRPAALAATAVVASLPALWINAMGILSEPLYGLVLLACLLALSQDPRTPRRLGVLALLLAALVLTRTAGLALVAAYAAWALSRRSLAVGARIRLALPAAAAPLAYVAWVLLRPEGTADINVQALGERLEGGSPEAMRAFGVLLARQANSIAEAWVGSLVIYWLEGRPLRFLLPALAGLVSLAGLALRLREGRADAWVMAAYLLTFLLWPFHDQMGRFIFPALPVLVVYALYAVQRTFAARAARQRMALAVAVLLFLSLTVPALGFIYQRARSPEPYARIVDWYRTPDLRHARARAGVHVSLLDDMAAIRERTSASDRVMWYAPAYLALLAGRSGVRAPDPRLAPDAYRAEVQRSGAAYVFLTAYHPRDTISDAAWRAGLRALEGRLRVVHAGTPPGGTQVTSLLYSVR